MPISHGLTRGATPPLLQSLADRDWGEGGVGPGGSDGSSGGGIRIKARHGSATVAPDPGEPEGWSIGLAAHAAA